MAEGHDREILRRLEEQADRIERVEDTMSEPVSEARVGYGKWHAMIRGASAESILMILLMIVLVVGVSLIALMSYTHMNDTRAAGENFARIVQQGEREFTAAIKELTAVQREGNCLVRTKAADPEMCRSMMR